MTFSLTRSPLVQFVAVVLLAAATLLVVPIVLLNDRRTKATAVASYFFSLWSIRAAFASQMMTFPTTLDLAVLSLCAVLPVALLLWMLADAPQGGGDRDVE